MQYRLNKITLAAALLITVSGCAIQQATPSNNNAIEQSKNSDQDTSASINRCTHPIATVALEESNNPSADPYAMTSPIPAVRLIMARSNCFRVVNRGQALAGIILERNLHEQGELAASSQVTSGKLVPADYLISAQVLSNNSNAGGMGLSLSGLGNGFFGGALKSKKATANVLLTFTNISTGVQEFVVEGSAKKSDLGAELTHSILWNQSALSAYQNTEMEKVIIIAFLNAHNKLVSKLKQLN